MNLCVYVTVYKGEYFGPFDTPKEADAWGKRMEFDQFCMQRVCKPEHAKEFMKSGAWGKSDWHKQ